MLMVYSLALTVPRRDFLRSRCVSLAPTQTSPLPAISSNCRAPPQRHWSTRDLPSRRRPTLPNARWKHPRAQTVIRSPCGKRTNQCLALREIKTIARILSRYLLAVLQSSLEPGTANHPHVKLLDCLQVPSTLAMFAQIVASSRRTAIGSSNAHPRSCCPSASLGCAPTSRVSAN